MKPNYANSDLYPDLAGGIGGGESELLMYSLSLYLETYGALGRANSQHTTSPVTNSTPTESPLSLMLYGSRIKHKVRAQLAHSRSRPGDVNADDARIEPTTLRSHIYIYINVYIYIHIYA